VPVDPGVESRDVLTQVLRNGAQDMLARSVLDEVAMYVAERADLVDDQGHHLVVRNGYPPQRKIMTGIGAVEVQQPRVRDRRPVDEREKFASSILPPYLRKTKSVEELLESTFSTVRARTNKTKGSGSRTVCLTMVFKLVQSAEKRWRVLNGSTLIPEVVAGVAFVDGLKKDAA
jgi:hypothetical protein